MLFVAPLSFSLIEWVIIVMLCSLCAQHTKKNKKTPADRATCFAPCKTHQRTTRTTRLMFTFQLAPKPASMVSCVGVEMVGHRWADYTKKKKKKKKPRLIKHTHTQIHRKPSEMRTNKPVPESINWIWTAVPAPAPLRLLPPSDCFTTQNTEHSLSLFAPFL